jgi:hypothetical protein
MRQEIFVFLSCYHIFKSHSDQLTHIYRRPRLDRAFQNENLTHKQTTNTASRPDGAASEGIERGDVGDTERKRNGERGE